MVHCGHCNKNHDNVEQVKACFSGETVASTATPSTSRGWTPDPNKIVTANCAKITCRKTHTGPVSELAGWRCDEHQITPLPFNIGEKALWHDRRFEVLEIGSDRKTVRLRTGGQGKIVPIEELTAIS